ncbi:unnamed protein product, partial [marine sediment metagenome]
IACMETHTPDVLCLELDMIGRGQWDTLLEELYWRGFMHQKLAKKRRPGPVILLTALFYSLYHFLSVIPLFAWPFNVMMVIPVFLAGLIWGYMRYRSGSLLGSIICHALADTGIMAVYLLYLA